MIWIGQSSQVVRVIIYKNRGLNPGVDLAVVQYKFGYCVENWAILFILSCLCNLDEMLQAVWSLYLVSMPGEVKLPIQGKQKNGCIPTECESILSMQNNQQIITGLSLKNTNTNVNPRSKMW